MKALYVNIDEKQSSLLDRIQSVTGTSQKVTVIEALLCYAEYLNIIKDRRDFYTNFTAREVSSEG